MTYEDCANALKGLKEEKPWLKEVDSIALQQSLREQEKAFRNFFRGSGYPKFKKKHGHFCCYRGQTTDELTHLSLFC